MLAKRFVLLNIEGGLRKKCRILSKNSTGNPFCLKGFLYSSPEISITSDRT